MQTHQSHKTAQLRFLEIVKFPIETTGHFSLVTCVFMQCKSVVMQFEAREMKIRGGGALSALVSGNVAMVRL